MIWNDLALGLIAAVALFVVIVGYLAGKAEGLWK